MRTLYVDVALPRIVITRLLGHLTRSAYWGPTAPLRYAEMPSPPLPGPRWVRVRNRLCGICGTDLHFAFADGEVTVAPAALPGNERIYLGHEVVGHVIEVGTGVTQFEVGQRVVLQQAFPNCLTRELDPPCARCAEGEVNLCEGSRTEGALHIGGGWGDEMVVHESQLYAVPDTMPDEQAALLEPSAVGVRAVLRRRPVAGRRALIIGCGSIGLLTLQALRAAAPNVEVTCLARYPFQGEYARRQGSHRVIVGRASYREMAEITGGIAYRGMLGNETLLGGFDVTYDTVGSAATLKDALRWTRAGGAVVLVGASFAPLKVDLTPVWFHEVDLIGVMTYGRERWQGEQISTFDLTRRWIEEGKMSPQALITHRFPLSAYQEALRVASDKRSGAVKVLFEL